MITCPHCGYLHDEPTDLPWTEDDSGPRECHFCDKAFWVRVNITVNWTVYDTEDNFEDDTGGQAQ